MTTPASSGLSARARLVLGTLAWGAAAAAIGVAVAPFFKDTTTLGGHDWDQMAAHRYLVVKTLRVFHQFPFWNPYACGGHPNWGGIESGTTIVSPFLPLYLAAPLALAQRIEVVTMVALASVGAWLLAGRFTRSPGLRLFAAAVWAFDGRWALQIAAGHAWHMYYAWSAFALWFLDRAARGVAPGRARWKDAVFAGAILALMVYTGAIYPLPQTALVLGCWALAVAWLEKSLAPVRQVALAGLVSVGLSAPKLFPVIDTLLRFPRHIESPETLSWEVLVASLTAPSQAMGSHPAPVSHWGWHEWGMYVGWAPVVVLVVAILRARTRLERALRLLGLALFVVACGSFATWAPWPLLHELPIFSSQHVPSRWMYMALLVLVLLVAALGERLLAWTGRARVACEVALVAGAAAVAMNIGKNDVAATSDAFWMRLPPITAEPTFRQERAMPAQYQYVVRDWAPAALGAEMAGIGVIECNTFPGLNVYAKDAAGVIHGLGAHGRGDPAYRGEAWLPGGQGTATIERFTPNEIAVRVAGARPGDLLVLNQNWDPSWRANGERVLNHEDTVATKLAAADATVTFRYRPRTFAPALALFAATLGAIAWAWRRRGAAA